MTRPRALPIRGFSGRLRLALRERGTNAHRAARRMGFAYGAVMRWVHEEQLPSAWGLIALCSHLNVSADWLLFGPDEPLRPRPAPPPAATLSAGPGALRPPLSDARRSAGAGGSARAAR